MTCIHAYMHTCIHAYMHTCIHAYMHTCVHAYMHAYMHTYIHTVYMINIYYIYMCVYTYKCVQTTIYRSIIMQTNIAHVYANIGQLKCIYTCMHTYIFHSGATFGTACEAESESIWFPYIYIKNPPGHLKGFRDPNPKYNGKRPDSKRHPFRVVAQGKAVPLKNGSSIQTAISYRL